MYRRTGMDQQGGTLTYRLISSNESSLRPRDFVYSLQPERRIRSRHRIRMPSEVAVHVREGKLEAPMLAVGS